MDEIPTPPVHVTADPLEVDPRADPGSKPLHGPDETHRASREQPAAGLRVERRTVGTAVTGPLFFVWGADHAAALGWARPLARLLELTPGLQTAPAPAPSIRRHPGGTTGVRTGGCSHRRKARLT